MNEFRSGLALAGRRGLAAGAAAALLAGAVAAPAANAQQDGVLPNNVVRYSETVATAEQGSAQISLSASTFDDAGDHQLTVTGSGFNDASVLGSRPPLAGKGAGVYVVFGKFADDWKPSLNAPSTSRPAADTKWAVAAADMATIGGEEGGAIELRPDGTFTATLTVSKAEADTKAGESAGNYGVYVYAGSGAKHGPWEVTAPISFTDGGDDSGPTPGPTPDPEPGATGSLGSLTDLLPF